MILKGLKKFKRNKINLTIPPILRKFSQNSSNFNKEIFLENIKNLGNLEEEEQENLNFFHYKVLDLDKMAPLEEIKTQFRQISNSIIEY